MLDALVSRVAELELLEQLAGPLTRPPGTEVEQPAEHLEVLTAGEDLVDRGVLTGEADVAPHVHRLSYDVETGDHVPGRRLDE